jgi:hypothetical protein
MLLLESGSSIFSNRIQFIVSLLKKSNIVPLLGISLLEKILSMSLEMKPMLVNSLVISLEWTLLLNGLVYTRLMRPERKMAMMAVSREERKRLLS